MEQLLATLKGRHAAVAAHVVGAIVIDGHHRTEGKVLARARVVFASLGESNRGEGQRSSPQPRRPRVLPTAARLFP
jgi:hypothetical protein